MGAQWSSTARQAGKGCYLLAAHGADDTARYGYEVWALAYPQEDSPYEVPFAMTVGTDSNGPAFLERN